MFPDKMFQNLFSSVFGLTMTGDSVSEHHRSEIFNHVKQNRRTTKTLDKEVQYDLADAMDYEVADSGIGGSCELATVIVEINSSPSGSSDTHSHVLNDGEISPNTTVIEHNHHSSIRRDSIEKLRQLDETDLTTPDSVDCATLPVAYRLDNPRLDDGNEGVDEIKEQMSLVAMNNFDNSDERTKMKEHLDGTNESNCALDCLSFTIQCCECTIL